MSMFNFAPTANQQPKIELIPAGTPLLCLVTLKQTQRSQNTDGMLAQLEFTVVRGPFENRKMWMYLGDPNDEKHKEEYRQMSLANLQHMLESSGIFNPADPTTYGRYATAAPADVFIAILRDLEGKHVAMKAKVEKGKDGYDDKNVPGVILSPNPNGRTAKDYEGVKAGSDINVQKPAAAAPAGGAGFGGFGTPAATPAAAAAPAAQAGGFAGAATPAAQSATPAWLDAGVVKADDIPF